MVLLNPRTAAPHTTTVTTLHSSMVLLNRLMIVAVNNRSFPLHSSMVLLNRTRPHGNVTLLPNFTFQYGSIKSTNQFGGFVK